MDHRKNLETCLVIVTGFLIIYIFKEWYPLLIAAVAIGIVGIFFKYPAEWITWIWYKIAEILGKIVPGILLSVVYFLFLIPLAFLSRIFRREHRNIKSRNAHSQWIERNKVYIDNDLTKPW